MNKEQTNQISYRQESWRKLTHLCALIIPGGYYYLELNQIQMLSIMIPIALFMILIDVARLRRWKFWNLFKALINSMAREHELNGDFTGATYILVTSCLAIALFSKPVAIASLAFIMTGDTAAALIGRKFGKHKFGHKSFEGSFAFLGAAIITAFFIPELLLSIAIIGAVVATVTEALSTTIDDNTSVPLVSGLVMHILLKIL